ncbi:hypothetical protein D3C86_1773240 [compost metagenome]
MATLPTRSAMARARAWVASLVCRPRITSIRVMTGTGLKKCRPMKRSGRSTLAASSVIESDEVLVAITQSAFTWALICSRMRSFKPRFSVAASITRSTSLRRA